MFRSDVDVEISGGQATLTSRGRIKFSVGRITLMTATVVLFLCLIALLAVAANFPSLLGASGKRLFQIRIQADADARIVVATQRKQMVLLAGKAVDASDDSIEGKVLRLKNLQRILNQQNMAISEARKDAEIEGDFEPLTYLQEPTTGRRIPVNATADGRIRPEVVAAFIANDKELSALMDAVNEEALSQAKPNSEEKVREDLARLLKEK